MESCCGWNETTTQNRNAVHLSRYALSSFSSCGTFTASVSQKYECLWDWEGRGFRFGGCERTGSANANPGSSWHKTFLAKFLVSSGGTLSEYILEAFQQHADLCTAADLEIY